MDSLGTGFWVAVSATALVMWATYAVGQMSRDREVALLEGHLETARVHARHLEDEVFQANEDLLQCEAERASH